MPEAKLRAALDQLQRTLDEDQAPLSEEDAAALEAVADRIERLLEQTQESQLEHVPAARAEVGGALERFEAEHPELTRLLSAIANTLSSLGI